MTVIEKIKDKLVDLAHAAAESSPPHDPDGWQDLDFQAWADTIFEIVMGPAKTPPDPKEPV